jgi:hypothetical protein
MNKIATQMSGIAPLLLISLFIALFGMFFNSDYAVTFVSWVRNGNK